MNVAQAHVVPKEALCFVPYQFQSGDSYWARGQPKLDGIFSVAATGCRQMNLFLDGISRGSVIYVHDTLPLLSLYFTISGG